MTVLLVEQNFDTVLKVCGCMCILEKGVPNCTETVDKLDRIKWLTYFRSMKKGCGEGRDSGLSQPH